MRSGWGPWVCSAQSKGAEGRLWALLSVTATGPEVLNLAKFCLFKTAWNLKASTFTDKFHKYCFFIIIYEEIWFVFDTTPYVEPKYGVSSLWLCRLQLSCALCYCSTMLQHISAFTLLVCECRIIGSRSYYETLLLIIGNFNLSLLLVLLSPFNAQKMSMEQVFY